MAVAGLAFGLSLIVAIGPQNAFVLRQGATRRHVIPVVTICATSDLVLIAAGVAGAGTVLDGSHALRLLARFGGAACLIAYALVAARRATRTSAPDAAAGLAANSLTSVVATCLAFTWLNPAVYLDTVVLLGAVASAQHEPWAFALGAGAASVLWFAALGFGARLLAPLLNSARAWRTLDALVALVMAVTAARVLAGA